MVSHPLEGTAATPESDAVRAPVEAYIPEEPAVQDVPPTRRRRRPTRNKVLVGLAVVLAAAAGVVVTLVATSGGSSIPALSVTTQHVTVTTGTMRQTVAASGTIEPSQQANLQFGVSGQVNAVYVSAGQKVTKGQVLARINPTALQDEVNAARATLSADQARLSTDQSKAGSTSQIDSDEAAVTAATSQLSTAQTNLADANLTSTITGTVASVNLAPGQEVSGSSGSGTSGSGGSGSNASGSSGASGLGSSSSGSNSSSSGSSNDIVVVSTDSFTVNTTVDDTEVGQIQTGDQAVITPSGSSTPVYGTVSSIGLIAASSSASVASFPVTIAVTGSPSGLYAGSSATVTIIVKQLYNVVEVPTGAVSYVNGQPTVTKVVGGSQVAQAVTTGISTGGETQITGGVKAGDVVVDRVVRFNASTGSGRNILGGGGARTGTGGAGGGGGGFFGGGGGGGGGGLGGGGFRGGAGSGTGG
jgi:multidrug efflux pump subunit AcrA (membrane-fusion protein)